jgi:hypothetical protein
MTSDQLGSVLRSRRHNNIHELTLNKLVMGRIPMKNHLLTIQKSKFTNTPGKLLMLCLSVALLFFSINSWAAANANAHGDQPFLFLPVKGPGLLIYIQYRPAFASNFDPLKCAQPFVSYWFTESCLVRHQCKSGSICRANTQYRAQGTGSLSQITRLEHSVCPD